jgi:hypothetical protein
MKLPTDIIKIVSLILLLVSGNAFGAPAKNNLSERKPIVAGKSIGTSVKIKLPERKPIVKNNAFASIVKIIVPERKPKHRPVPIVKAPEISVENGSTVMAMLTGVLLLVGERYRSRKS